MNRGSRLQDKAVIYFIVIIIAILGYIGEKIYNSIMDQTSGCTNDVLTRFIGSDIANQYQKGYIYQIQQETASNGASHVDWSMSRISDGCLFSASVQTADKKYLGDNFLVDPKTRFVTAKTSGAVIFFSTYKGNHYLP